MRARDAGLLVLLLALAFGLRFHALDRPAGRWGDELVHVPAATHYWTKGHFDPNLWEHPPLRHLLLYPFLAVLGDDAYGWRLRNVVFGALAAVLVALLAYSVDRSRAAAAIAGLLLATDPLHVVLSRFTFEEIYGVTLFLGALVAFTFARGRSAWLLVSGLLMGCALATKWYYVPVWLLVTGLALRDDGAWRRPAGVLFVLSAFVAVPVAVYALAFGPWFGRGYALGELVELTTNAYFSLQHMEPEMFNTAYAYLHRTSPLEWFVVPVMFGQELSRSADGVGYLVFGNNLVAWGLTLPALAVCGWTAVRRRSLAWGLPVLCFVATYAVPIAARRPTFVYSAIPLLPFAFVAIALALDRLAARYGPAVAGSLAAVLVASNLLLVPLATGDEVPSALYAPVLSVIDLAGP
jgi:dolichyl-phosphate-mannose--protein O-mannosyl transferase